MPEPHVVPRPETTAPHLTQRSAISGVEHYSGSLSGKTPESVRFGMVATHLRTAMGDHPAWVISYHVDLPPPSGGAPGAAAGPPNIKTMSFIVDDVTGKVLEAIGYFD